MVRKYISILLVPMMLGCHFLSQPPPATPPVRSTLTNPQLFVASDCMSACWQGLRPGITTTDEIANFNTSGSPFRIGGTVNRDGRFSYHTVGNSNGFDLTLVVLDDMLYRIEILGLVDYTLEDVINELGPPDYSWLSYSISPRNPEVYSITFMIYYPDTGYIFRFDERSGFVVRRVSDTENEICFNPDILAYGIFVVEAGTIEDVIRRQIVPTNGMPDSIIQNYMSSMIAWPGLQCVRFPNP